MSWDFRVAVEADGIRLAVAEFEAGDECIFNIRGEEHEPGYVRVPTVHGFISGKVSTLYEVGDPYTTEGLAIDYCPVHPEPQIHPAGKAEVRALESGTYFCASPREGECFQGELYEAPEVLAARPDSYVICLKGEIDIDGRPFGQFEVAHDRDGKELVVNCSPDAAYLHVWRR